jgi:hypothetical protein
MIWKGKVCLTNGFGIEFTIAQALSRVTVTAPPLVRRWQRFCSEVSVIVAPAEVWKLMPSAAVFAAFSLREERDERRAGLDHWAPLTCRRRGERDRERCAHAEREERREQRGDHLVPPRLAGLVVRHQGRIGRSGGGAKVDVVAAPEHGEDGTGLELRIDVGNLRRRLHVRYEAVAIRRQIGDVQPSRKVGRDLVGVGQSEGGAESHRKRVSFDPEYGC